MHLGLAKEDQSPGLISVKIVEPGIINCKKSDLMGSSDSLYSFLKLDQVYIFLCLGGMRHES